jgi:hypothetical protein
MDGPQRTEIGRLSLPELIELMHRVADEIESRCMVLEGRSEDGAVVLHDHLADGRHGDRDYHDRAGDGER